MSFLRIAIGVLVSLLVAVPVLIWVLMAPVVSSLPPPTDISVDPVRLREHVEILSGGEVARNHDHPERLDAVATYIEAEFQKAGPRRNSEMIALPASVRRAGSSAALGPQVGRGSVYGEQMYDYRDLSRCLGGAAGGAGIVDSVLATGGPLLL